MTKDEALRRALEALNCAFGYGTQVVDTKISATITIIKAVLEENKFNPDWDTQAVLTEEIQRMAKRIEELEAKDEPVAWMFQHEETGRTMCVDAQQLEWGFEKGNPRLKKIAPLYTAPPQRTWVGLTDEDIEQEFGFIDELLRDCVQRTEAKLKEKNT